METIKAHYEPIKLSISLLNITFSPSAAMFKLLALYASSTDAVADASKVSSRI